MLIKEMCFLYYHVTLRVAVLFDPQCVMVTKVKHIKHVWSVTLFSEIYIFNEDVVQ